MGRTAGFDVVAEYVLDGASAWKSEHWQVLSQALADARIGKYDVLLCRALDRVSCEDVGVTLESCGLP
jgi:DNA invertase Pin-like site-specific DNA recombinase